MATPNGKKKPKIQASEVAVGNRTLEGVLLDLAEQVKANDAQSAERAARTEELCRHALERSVRAEERSARAEEGSRLALQTIASVLQDLRAITLEFREANQRAEARFGVLEARVGI